ncbi:MAG: hypothetical protein CM15mP55_2870 [Hyphomicrobiales bacterium]|nr:MAG: hypothetical protein CM15mP55_2870 [Hyphomicrobiales bacterium]
MCALHINVAPVWRITSSEYTVLVMAVDILELAEFMPVSMERGRVCKLKKIDALMGLTQAEPVLGFGYVTAYADALGPHAVWHLCMPAQQGVLVEDRPAGARGHWSMKASCRCATVPWRAPLLFTGWRRPITAMRF